MGVLQDIVALRVLLNDDLAFIYGQGINSSTWHITPVVTTHIWSRPDFRAGVVTDATATVSVEVGSIHKPPQRQVVTDLTTQATDKDPDQAVALALMKLRNKTQLQMKDLVLNMPTVA